MMEDPKAFAAALQQILAEKNLSEDEAVSTISLALAAAYRKDHGQKNQNIVCDFDLKTGTWRMFDEKVVSASPKRPEMTEEELEVYLEKRREYAQAVADAEAMGQPAPERPAELPEYLDEKTEVSLEDAQLLKAGAVVGDVIRVELPVLEIGRMGAQTAKQVIIQRMREVERERVFAQFSDKVGTMVNAFVQRVEGRMVFCDIQGTQAIMPPQEQASAERYRPGDRIRVYVMAVNKGTRGADIIVSRAHPEIVRQLFVTEVPEIEAGTVMIKAVAREAGARTKIAVVAADPNVDPVGSCVGQKGSRVQTVISELGGQEKIDIIEWSDDAVQFITNALSPAKIVSVTLDESKQEARVEVAEDQLSLAIGRGGQNVRLASELTGWNISLASMGGEAKPATADEATDGEAAIPITEQGDEQAAGAEVPKE